MYEYEGILHEKFRGKTRLKKEMMGYYEQQNNRSITIKKIPPFEYAYIMDVKNESKFHTLNFLLELKKNVFINVDMKIPSEYPFKPPYNILINNFNYHELLQFENVYLKKLGYDEKICLCCQSLACKNNWSLQKNIRDMLKEIYKNLNNKLRIRDLKMCKYVVEKKFGHYLPIEEFL
tara:strand:+ start:339 stop:869 length:531 start_codon:yes stop_codon:yes gene_type:complete